MQTERLHTDMKFKGSNGTSNFVFVDIDAVRERNALLGPEGDEFWVLNGRVNHLWQSLYDDKRKPHLIQRFPATFIEISPADADRLGIISGDMVAVESERVRTAEGTISSGGVTAVAYVTDAVPSGVIFSMFHYPGSPVNAVVTADASTTPINPRQPFKFGRGTVTRIGPTELAEIMPFTPRNLV
ncbi:MAG: molybdopterin dinucleotide binding domain-containing protein [Dehalococcoidia bacterium]|nr:molybdopterin dinucleotide binding domain-containing protein [Dehalococcoidia bacterium]